MTIYQEPFCSKHGSALLYDSKIVQHLIKSFLDLLWQSSQNCFIRLCGQGCKNKVMHATLQTIILVLQIASRKSFERRASPAFIAVVPQICWELLLRLLLHSLVMRWFKDFYGKFFHQNKITHDHIQNVITRSNPRMLEKKMTQIPGQHKTNWQIKLSKIQWLVAPLFDLGWQGALFWMKKNNHTNM